MKLGECSAAPVRLVRFFNRKAAPRSPAFPNAVGASIALAMVACASSIAAYDLGPATEADVVMRRVFWTEGGLRGDAPIAPQDVLVLTADSGALLGLSAHDGPNLVANAVSLRLPLWILKEYQRIDVSIGNGEGTVVVCSTAVSGCNNVIAGGTLQDVAARLSRTALHATVEPRAADPARPGDVISVRLEYYTRTLGPSGLYVQSTSLGNRVSADGRLSIPSLARQSALVASPECDRFPEVDCGDGLPSPLPDDARAFSRERGVVADIENAARRVVVWRPAENLPLWQVERCLNTLRWITRGRPDEASRQMCAALGIDERFLPTGNPEYYWPRYSLSFADSSWQLVDFDGNVHALPYLAGRSIESSMSAALRQIGGREFDRIRFGRPLYITVVPAEGDPFFGEASPVNGAGRLDEIALAPSDTVRISMNAPRTLSRPEDQ